MKHGSTHTSKRHEEQAYLAWYTRVNSKGEPFDPSSLVALARTQWSNMPHLAEAFAHCTLQWNNDELYTYFMNPATIGQPGGRWNFAANIPLQCPERGALLVDVMKDGSIGGIEYLDRVMGHPVAINGLFVALAAHAGRSKGLN